jgi:hypothetical protein
MFKKVAVTILVVGGIMLAIALAPNVPTALATAHVATSAKDTLQQPLADQSCAAFETWFLDPACSTPHPRKKAARTKHHERSILARGKVGCAGALDTGTGAGLPVSHLSGWCQELGCLCASPAERAGSMPEVWPRWRVDR